MKKRMTVNGMHTLLELQGIPCIPLDQTVATPKSIVCSRTFARAVRDKDQKINWSRSFPGTRPGSGNAFAARSAWRGNSRSSCSRTASGWTGRSTATQPPSSHTPDLIRAAQRVLEQIFKPGYEYRKAGVMVFGIEKEQGRRLNLFEPSAEERARSKAVMAVMDRINARWGSMTMRVAAEGTGQRWVMRQAHLSPRYTTDWKALPIAS